MTNPYISPVLGKMAALRPIVIKKPQVAPGDWLSASLCDLLHTAVTLQDRNGRDLGQGMLVFGLLEGTDPEMRFYFLLTPGGGRGAAFDISAVTAVDGSCIILATNQDELEEITYRTIRRRVL